MSLKFNFSDFYQINDFAKCHVSKTPNDIGMSLYYFFCGILLNFINDTSKCH